MAPTVSVIIPVYNASDVLGETLGYLSSQVLTDFEAILVDDGSTDDSAAIADRLCAQDSRFRLIRKPNGGAASARNAGLAQARGTYVSFLDADDLFRPELLLRLVEAIDGTSATFSCCEADIFHVDTQQSSAFFRFSPDLTEGVHECSEFGERLFQSFNKTAWNKLYRRDRVLEGGVLFQDLPNMNDLYFVETMLAISKSVAIVRGAYVSYRRGRGVSLQDLRHKRPECTLMAAAHLHDDVVGRGVLDEAGLLSLKNELWRLCIQATESAVAGGDERVVSEILGQVQELSAAWGIDDLDRRQYSTAAYALWHWCYARVSTRGLMWAYRGKRAPVAERQSMATNLRTAARLVLASLRG